eukprot:gene1933-2368_t
MSNQEIACKEHQFKEINAPVGKLGKFPIFAHNPEIDNVYFILSKNCTEQCKKNLISQYQSYGKYMKCVLKMIENTKLGVPDIYDKPADYPSFVDYQLYLIDRMNDQEKKKFEKYLIKPMTMDDLKF